MFTEPSYDSLNYHAELLYNHYKNFSESKPDYMVTCLMTTKIYDQNSVFNCGHKSQATCTLFSLPII